MVRRPPTKRESRATNTAGSRDTFPSGSGLDALTPGNVDPNERDDTGLQNSVGLGQSTAPTETGFLNGEGGMFAAAIARNKQAPRFQAEATALQSRQRLLMLGKQIEETRSAV